MKNKILLITSLGSYANQVLQRATKGFTAGTASRGAYLQLADDWTLFLSLESYRGPLTLNLAGGHLDLSEIQPGSQLLVNQNGIFLPEAKIQITCDQADVWSDPLPADRPGIPSLKLEQLLQQAQQLAKNNSMLPLLEMVLSKNPLPLAGVPGLDTRLFPCLRQVETGDFDQTGDNLINLLGFGPGLTPLGDDFILGVLLTLNRWKVSLLPEKSLVSLNQAVLQTATKRTTQLSTSLLFCAAEGAADERLTTVLDTTFSGKEIPDSDLQNMLSWGSSSGIAVLAGMLAAVSGPYWKT